MNYKLYLSILLAFVFVFSPVFAVSNYDVSVAVSPKSITTKPCGIATYDITINNVGELQDAYTVTVGGIPNGWYSLSSDTITVTPGNSDKIYLFITPNCYENNFGQFNGTVTLTSRANLTATDKFNLIVVPDHILKLTLPDQIMVCQGEEQQAIGILVNLGNYTENVAFTVSGDASAFTTVPDNLVINSGKTNNVTFTVNPANVELGSYGLTIDAASATSYASASASTMVKVVKCYDVDVTFPQTVQACGGKTKTFNITVKNIGLKEDEYTLTIGDLNYSTTVALQPGQAKSLSIDFMNEAEGTYEVSFTVESTFVKKEGTITFAVTKCYGIALTIEENLLQIVSGTGKMIKGKITNTGLFADTWKIISDVIWSSVRPEQVNLSTNESQDVYAYYSPEYGAQGTYLVNLTAKSSNSQDTQMLTIEVLSQGEVTTTTVPETTVIEETTPVENITITVNETTPEQTTPVEETTPEITQPNVTITTPAGGIPTGEVIKGFWENKIMRSLLISIIIVIIILIVIYLVVMR